MSAATGVLPVPPTERLPTEITGTGARESGSRATRRAVMAATTVPIGVSRRATPFSVLQNLGGRMHGCRFDGNVAGHLVGYGGDAVESRLELEAQPLSVSRGAIPRHGDGATPHHGAMAKGQRQDQ